MLERRRIRDRSLGSDHEEEVAEDVLSSLEFDLTKSDSSDNELLLRLVEGDLWSRGSGAPPTVVDSTTLADFSTDSGRFSTTTVDGLA